MCNFLPLNLSDSLSWCNFLMLCSSFTIDVLVISLLIDAMYQVDITS